MLDLHTRALSSLSSIIFFFFFFFLFRPSCFALFAANMTAEFPHDFVQETLERLDSCHDGNFSRILLRMEYLDRIILNCGELADSIVLDPP